MHDTLTTKAFSRSSGQVATRVYEELTKQILEGDLPPGTHLSQQSIAVSMNTSNGPVIGALRRLAHEGLVMYKPGQGFRVCDWSLQHQESRLVVRRALETEAARLASRRAGREDIESLYRLVARMGELIRAGQTIEASKVDVSLHAAIASLTRCADLMEALEHCHVVDIIRRRAEIKEREGTYENLEEIHRTVVDAIATGDPDVAAKAMHDHLSPKK